MLPLALLLIGTSVAVADGPAALADCRELHQRQPEQGLQRCLLAYEEATAEGREADALEALFHASAAQQALGRFDEAQATLDRIEARPSLRTSTNDRFRLQRRRGTLAFRRGDPAAALRAFDAAAALAQALGDRERAIALNDRGVVQRRLGDYPAALDSFIASLEIKMRLGADDQLGATLDNIGQVYLESDDLDGAETYFRRALAAHEADEQPLKAAHTRESLGLLAQRRGDAAAAAAEFEAAWTVLTQAQATPDRVRVGLHRAELAAEQGRRAELQHWLAQIEPLLPASAPLTYSRLRAQAEAMSGATDAAFTQLERALAGASAAPASERLRALQRLAGWAEERGDYARAVELQRAAFAAERALDEQQRGELLDNLRIRFDVAEHERQSAVLAAENARQAVALEQRRRTQLLIAGAAVVLLLLGFGAHRRRVWRLRLEGERRRAQLQAELDGFRAAAERLRVDRHRLQVAFDRTADAMLLVDAGGRVRLANRAARRLLDRDALAPDDEGESLADWLGTASAAQVEGWWRRLDDDDHSLQAPVLLSDAGRPDVWVQPLALEEELIVLGLGAERGPSASARDMLAGLQRLDRQRQDSEVPQADADADAGRNERRFRERLVALMRATVDAWEAGTRKTRLDLAERSGIWRITVDDGRLRVRTLERYLSLDRLPEHPRWREVLRTAYYVLAECPLDENTRTRLRDLVDEVKAFGV